MELIEYILENAFEKRHEFSLKIYHLNSLKNGELKYNVYELEESYYAVKRIGVDLR